MRLTTAESSVWCSGFHFCTESQVWNIKEDIQREKTGLGDLTTDREKGNGFKHIALWRLLYKTYSYDKFTEVIPGKFLP